MSDSGYYRMHRGWMDHPLFEGERFSRAQAWCWMIEHANWKSTDYADRGQLRTTFRQLATAWGWSTETVHRFIAELKTQTMISAETKRRFTLINISNYAKYQSDEVAVPNDNQTVEQTITKRKPNATEERKKEITNTPPIVPPTASNPDEKRDKPLKPVEQIDLSLPACLDRRPAKSSTSRKRPATPLPEGWAPSPGMIALATEKHPDLDIRHETDRFRDSALANDRRYSDWNAAWRNWLSSPYAGNRQSRDRGDPNAREREGAERVFAA